MLAPLHSLCRPVGDLPVRVLRQGELQEPGDLQAEGGDEHHAQVAEVRGPEHQRVADGLVPFIFQGEGKV